ncbi:zinc ribbon domain-containing protein [Desulfofundulus thermosubterraneus]|uniref:Putative transposase DNA-binding domain-containing protein n=1 Tax=Desulfofundulus thermosubterraneus DSM 16057 TaxID=1121432 RepID=A0A1M6JE60_9FIRM|nr:zinc ribbon domain-containing protein [Desulfofundulus thermosubterraneus]SHJ44955.1 Putative transposase DNA-binding domain-containing protein [Desulfofundulus thermosubterraneus DSM 16057]
MGRSKTDSFVVEIPLRANSEQTRKALARFEAGRQIYNACLGEALKRRDQMLRSKMYRAALAMPHKTKEEIKARAEAFKEAREKYGFTEFSLHAYAARIRDSWLGEHIDANTAQTLATRAYSAVNKTVTGEAKRVRFKRYGELNTLEGKTNKQGIRWRDGCLVWNGLELPAIIDEDDPVIMHGLSCPVKFVRLVKRTIRGRTRLYAQLVCEGKPYQKKKNYVTEGKISLDVGPSIVAEVGDTEANLHLFCRELDDIHTKIRVLQRRMDHQRRANNPDNYNPDGTIKKGRLQWKNSKRYLRTRARFAELNRRQAEHRKSLHGKLINDLLRKGNQFYLEDVSYRAFQRNFGRSVNYRASGMFVNRLEQKATAAKGRVVKFPTASTALSQMCQCGRKEKKKLSARWHRCDCGVTAQRDLYSGFLARHVKIDEEGNYYLDRQSAIEEWPTIKPLLDEAIEKVKRSYFYVAPASFGI